MIIYEILNTKTNKRYIGQTIQTLCQRKGQHLYTLRHNLNTYPKLQAAWNKYGESSFVFKEIFKCKDMDELDAKEQELIEELGHYNTALASRGPKHSLETRIKIGLGNKGKKVTEEHKAVLSKVNRGTNHPQCKLTELDVYTIKFGFDYSKYGMKSKIANLYNLYRGTVTNIVNNKKWTWIVKDYFSKPEKEKL